MALSNSQDKSLRALRSWSSAEERNYNKLKTGCRFAYPLRRLVLLRDVLGFKIAAGSRRILEAAFPPERFALPGHDPREEYDAMEAYLRTCSGRTIRNVFWSGNNYRLCGQQCAREGDGTRNPTRCTLPSAFPPAPRRREAARFSESEESDRCPDIDATSGRCFFGRILEMPIVKFEPNLNQN